MLLIVLFDFLYKGLSRTRRKFRKIGRSHGEDDEWSGFISWTFTSTVEQVQGSKMVSLLKMQWWLVENVAHYYKHRHYFKPWIWKRIWFKSSLTTIVQKPSLLLFLNQIFESRTKHLEACFYWREKLLVKKSSNCLMCLLRWHRITYFD